MKVSSKAAILRQLANLYPDARSELDFADPYQLIVAVMLSAQSTDRKVNEITPALFRRFSGFRPLAEAPVSDVEELIRPINYYKTKARHLVAMAVKVVNEHDGQLPNTAGTLRLLAGVGQKTANVILSELGFAPALPVDTHVFRVARRLGLAAGHTPEKVEDELKAIFEPDQWRGLHHRLIFHGRRVCKARGPLCKECGLRRLCPSRDKV